VLQQELVMQDVAMRQHQDSSLDLFDTWPTGGDFPSRAQNSETLPSNNVPLPQDMLQWVVQQTECLPTFSLSMIGLPPVRHSNYFKTLYLLEGKMTFFP
jgi:hypothetical protein